MKKLLALMLALTMALALAGCGSKSVVGTWKTTIDLEEATREKLGDTARIFHGVSVDLLLEMREDNSFTLSMDASGAMPLLREQLRDYVAESLGLGGMSLELYEGAYNKLIDERIDEFVTQLAAPVTGTYSEAEGKLSLMPSLGVAMTGSWEKNSLTLEYAGRQTSFSRK